MSLIACWRSHFSGALRLLYFLELAFLAPEFADPLLIVGLTAPVAGNPVAFPNLPTIRTDPTRAYLPWDGDGSCRKDESIDEVHHSAQYGLAHQHGEIDILDIEYFLNLVKKQSTRYGKDNPAQDIQKIFHHLSLLSYPSPDELYTRSGLGAITW